MEDASKAVLGGFPLGVDVKIWCHPDRFMDENRGRATWNKIMGYLGRAEAAARATRQVFDKQGTKVPEFSGQAFESSGTRTVSLFSPY
jgi:hypothetical protein